MKILITGGLGHIGSYVLKKANELKKINKIFSSKRRRCSDGNRGWFREYY